MRIRLAFATVVVLAAFPSLSPGQGLGLGEGMGMGLGAVLFPGSTVEGDIARGQGVLLEGASHFVLNRAVATSINTDTWMRLNEYIYQSILKDHEDKARRNRLSEEKRQLNYNEWRTRVANDPNGHDIARGSALNADLERLLKEGTSSFRSDSYELDSDIVRKIPFMYAPAKVTFALSRIAPSGKKWPITMRGPEYGDVRRNYERALDAVLELQNDGKTTREAVLNLKNAADALQDRLEKRESFEINKVFYLQAKDFIKRLRESAVHMQRNDVELIYGALDRFAGTNVYDLIKFMEKYNLQFGVPDIGEERGAYPDLHATLRAQIQDIENARNDVGVGRDGARINP